MFETLLLGGVAEKRSTVKVPVRLITCNDKSDTKKLVIFNQSYRTVKLYLSISALFAVCVAVCVAVSPLFFFHLLRPAAGLTLVRTHIFILYDPLVLLSIRFICIHSFNEADLFLLLYICL